MSFVYIICGCFCAETAELSYLDRNYKEHRDEYVTWFFLMQIYL